MENTLSNKIVDSHFSIGNLNTQNYLAKQHYTTLSEDNFFLNTFVQNHTELDPYTFKSIYNETINFPLFQGKATCNNYALSVARATFNCNSLPLFVWKLVDDNMEVRLTSTADSLTGAQGLVFQSSLVTPNINNAFVQTVAQWVSIVNTALNAAYLSLVSQYEFIHGAGSFVIDGGPASPPLLIYDHNNHFYFELADQYGGSANLLGISIGWNQYLNNKFGDSYYTLRDDSTAPNWYNLIVEDFGDNYASSIYTIKDQFYSGDFLIQPKKLLILTQMPIVSELTNGFYKELSTGQGPNYGSPVFQSTSNIPVKLLLDLSVDFDLTNMRNIVNYLPQNIRYYNITSADFNIIQWRFAWSSSDGVIYDIFLPYNASCSVKFQFTLR